MVPKFADNRNPNSLASRLRAKRNLRFQAMITSLSRPLKILDVGGRETVWETIGFADQPDIEITLLNIEPGRSRHPNIICVAGDARDMHQFGDKWFDVVYSNSVIEHVGDFDDMRRMAAEIRRVGKRYFLQTPYRYFPIEPHFLFPLFQFLPAIVQVELVRNLSLGWIGRHPNRLDAQEVVRSIRLLSHREVRSLFPDADITAETFMGLPKSLLAYRIAVTP